MPSLKDLRRKIGSVKNTQQITKAMKMVAASKLRRAQDAISSARPYAEKLELMTNRIVAEIREGAKGLGREREEQFLKNLHPLLVDRLTAAKDDSAEKSRVAMVVVTSDKGLCGGYNAYVIKHALLEHKRLTQDEGLDVQLIFIGRKGYDFFRRRGLEGEHLKDFWTGTFTTSKSDLLAKQMVERFMSGEFDAIFVVHSQFRSAISQTPTTKQVLPLRLSEKGESAALQSRDGAELIPTFIYEPGREAILAELLPSLVRTQFYSSMADALASEFGARMTAMDNASRNAGEVIGKLTLQMNRARQAAITKELMEIVSGAEALKA